MTRPKNTPTLRSAYCEGCGQPFDSVEELLTHDCSEDLIGGSFDDRDDDGRELVADGGREHERERVVEDISETWPNADAALRIHNREVSR